VRRDDHRAANRDHQQAQAMRRLRAKSRRTALESE